MRPRLALPLILVSLQALADKPADVPAPETSITAEAPDDATLLTTNETDVANDIAIDESSDEPPAPVTKVASDIAPPTPFIAVYSARISAARGETTMTLMPADESRFRFHSITEARGFARMLRSDPIVECSEFIAESTWQAARYTYRDGRKDSDIAFDIANGKADARYRDQSTTLDITADTTDRLLEQLLISRAIVEDKALSTRQVVDRATLQTIGWQFIGKERIRVDAGSFETVKYRRMREGSKRSSLIWFAPALDGLPVRIEQYRLDDRQARAELKRYTDAATLQARGTVTPVCP